MTDTSPLLPRRAPPRRRRGLLIPAIVVILIMIGVGVGLTIYAASGDAAKPGQGPGPGPGAAKGGRRGGGAGGRPPITVGVAKAALGDIPINVNALGTVTPLATVSLQARVSGQLEKVAFKEGQSVRKGQLLAQIDPRPYQVALQQAEATLLHDQALLADARLDLQRYATLKSQDSVAVQTYDTQAALVKQDEATVANDQAGVANAKLNLSYTRITSPVNGKIGLRQVDAGNQITANQTTPFSVVTQLDPISVVFSVPQVNIAAIEAQGAAGLPATAFNQEGGAAVASGRLATLDNLIDPTTGTVKAKAMFPNKNGDLFPNQFVNIVLLVDTLKNQVVVPTTATRHGPQGDFVWVLQPNRTVKVRLVKVGPGTPETVSIVSGLTVGESVITDGGDRLQDGASVILPGAAGKGGYGAGKGGAGGGKGGHGHHGGAAGPGGGSPAPA